MTRVATYFTLKIIQVAHTSHVIQHLHIQDHEIVRTKKLAAGI